MGLDLYWILEGKWGLGIIKSYCKVSKRNNMYSSEQHLMRLFPWKLEFVWKSSGTGYVWRILVLHTGLISGRILCHSINSVCRSWLNRNKSNYFPVAWFKNTLGLEWKPAPFLEAPDNGGLPGAITIMGRGAYWVFGDDLWCSIKSSFKLCYVRIIAY